jgi:hypothetical protein
VIAHRAMSGLAAAKSRIEFHASVHRSLRRLPLENAVWFTSVLPPGVARKVATIRENTSGRMQAIVADAAAVFGVTLTTNASTAVKMRAEGSRSGNCGAGAPARV